MKVFITRVIPEVAEKELKKHGFEVKVFKKDRPILPEELIRGAKSADAVISLLTDKFNAAVIDQLPNCKIIANYAVGYNNIDVKYAKQKGIVVTNTPDILTHATADLALALTLSCARRIPEGEELMRKGQFEGWKPKLLLGIELMGKTAGIIGAGRIGFETAKRLKAFGMNVLYYNRSKKPEFENELSAKKVRLDTLLKRSDVISVHLPLNDSTDHLLDKDKLMLMKKDGIFINTARGEIVDEKELIKILKAGRIFSAGFDVYEGEPRVNKELFKLKNVVLLPHLGSATKETRDAMAILAAKNVINVLGGKSPVTAV